MNTFNFENVQNEIGSLRKQIEEMLRHAQEKKDAVSEEMVNKLSRQLESLRQNASEQMRVVYHAGQTGVEETEKFVRKNPLLSLGIAFSAGCLLASLFKR